MRKNLLYTALLCLLPSACTPAAPDPAEVHYRLAAEAATPQQRETERRYVIDSLDLNRLRESERWEDYLNVWIDLHREPRDSFPAAITASSKELIASAAQRSPEMVRPLVTKLVKTLAPEKQLGAAAAIAAFPSGLDIPHTQYSRIAQRLMNAIFLPGNPAPPVDGLTAPPVRPEATLLFFYSSNCRTCQQLSAEMTRQYAELTGRGIRIVSISADTDPKAFETGSQNFPWPDKLCDFKGFDGRNFTNYDVAGTPALWLIDRQGIVTGQYLTLQEAGLLPDPQQGE